MARLGRQDWIDAAVAALVDDGVEAIAVEALARSLGVTKGSYYWHFDRRDDLLAAVLDQWEQDGTRAVIEAVERAAPDPHARLVELGRLTFGGSATDVDRIEPALRAWATADPTAAAVVARVDARRVGFVRDLLVAAGVAPAVAEHRAHLLYLALIGEWLWRSTGGAAISAATLDELLRLIVADAAV